jgi:hypothetical protein
MPRRIYHHLEHSAKEQLKLAPAMIRAWLVVHQQAVTLLVTILGR